ncbi:GNAT family N-acetyltransferase [Serratia sp. DD3]|uniref:GNAT family N-acetyltransferase n=1 Tax=Serratia sp. DD3 TaxID=1410619 RepID=UPI0003C4F120|nr:GNAT family N-acetyltransferase [Serratia sp. DD3]KEY57486.1 acetyltransferase [Serratia sp. DD3]
MKIIMLNSVTLPFYCGELAHLLMDAVTHGASVGYNSNLRHEEAENYFQSLQPTLANGMRLLWVVMHNNEAIGTVQLELCQKPNGSNRAEIQKLLVHSKARRHGVGRALMKTLEMTARSLRRGLLYLDTQAGSAAENLYHSLDYCRLGEIPDYATTPDGLYHPTVIYYKRLFNFDLSSNYMIN